jgi:hypothetical protein
VKGLASLALVAALLCVRPAAARAEAAVEGTVELPEETVEPAATPRYPISASYTIGPPDPPAAIVYLEGTFLPPPPGRAEMGQRHYQFAPGLLAVQRGTLVTFPNLDDEYHSVFSYSRTKRFDLGRYHKEETPPAILFDQPGLVKLYCEIHDHMRGTILVLDSPYFAKTDAAGRYRLERLPAGRRVLKAWLGEETVLERPVELRDGSTLRVDFPAKGGP